MCSRRPLFRTRKGPEILFELANVRINRSFFILYKVILNKVDDNVSILKKSLIIVSFFPCLLK